MYGKESRDDFGTLLTADNIYPYLEQRRADFKALQSEYFETGAIVYEGMDDPSYIPLEAYGY